MHNFYYGEYYNGKDWFDGHEKWERVNRYIMYMDFDIAVKEAEEYAIKNNVRVRVVDRCYGRTWAEISVKGE